MRNTRTTRTPTHEPAHPSQVPSPRQVITKANAWRWLLRKAQLVDECVERRLMRWADGR